MLILDSIAEKTYGPTLGTAATRLITSVSALGPPDGPAGLQPQRLVRPRVPAVECRVLVHGGRGQRRGPLGGWRGRAGDAEVQPAGRSVGPQSEGGRRSGNGATRVVAEWIAPPAGWRGGPLPRGGADPRETGATGSLDGRTPGGGPRRSARAAGHSGWRPHRRRGGELVQGAGQHQVRRRRYRVRSGRGAGGQPPRLGESVRRAGLGVLAAVAVDFVQARPPSAGWCGSSAPRRVHRAGHNRSGFRGRRTTGRCPTGSCSGRNSRRSSTSCWTGRTNRLESSAEVTRLTAGVYWKFGWP